MKDHTNAVANTDTSSQQNSSVSQKKYPYKHVRVEYPIMEANALTRTTIALYKALLFHQRNHDNCFPGYESLKKRSKIKSKTTISLHLKVLEWVGLIRKERRGKKQSNIYYVRKLTDEIIKKLKYANKWIVDKIKKETSEKSAKLKALREVHKRGIEWREQKKAIQESQKNIQSEVQQMDTKEVFHTSLNSSSNRNKESKIKEAEQKRGGGLKKFTDTPAFHMLKEKIMARKPLEGTEFLQVLEAPLPDTMPLKYPSKDFRGLSELESEIVRISKNIKDQDHIPENLAQTKNIYRKVAAKGKNERDLIDTIHRAEKLTLEIMGYLEKPGAYFFKVLRQMWNITS